MSLSAGVGYYLKDEFRVTQVIAFHLFCTGDVESYALRRCEQGVFL
jgi:hypothetical protein